MGKTTASSSHTPELLSLLEPQIEAMGYDLVDVEYHAGGPSPTLRVFIDREPAITLDDCEQVSRSLSAWLDVEDPIPGQYSLEVSSPGLDRVLRTREHFERFLGESVRVSLKAPLEGRRRFKGELQRLEDQSVVVRVDGEDFRLPLEMIDKARLVPELQ